MHQYQSGLTSNPCSKLQLLRRHIEDKYGPDGIKKNEDNKILFMNTRYIPLAHAYVCSCPNYIDYGCRSLDESKCSFACDYALVVRESGVFIYPEDFAFKIHHTYNDNNDNDNNNNNNNNDNNNDNNDDKVIKVLKGKEMIEIKNSQFYKLRSKEQIYEVSYAKHISKKHIDNVGDYDNIYACAIDTYYYTLYYLPTLLPILSFNLEVDEFDMNCGNLLALPCYHSIFKVTLSPESQNTESKMSSQIFTYDEISIQNAIYIYDVDNDITLIDEAAVILPASAEKKFKIYQCLFTFLADYISIKDVLLLIVDCLLGNERAEKVFENYSGVDVVLPSRPRKFEPFSQIHENSLNHYPLPRFSSDVMRTTEIYKWHQLE